MAPALLAALSIVLAMLVLALGDNLVEDVAQHMSVWQYLAFRGVMLLVPMALVLRWWDPATRIWPRRPAAVIARSSFSVIALMLYFAAIPLVKIPTAAAVLFTSPIFVILISVIVFRERVGLRRWVGVALGFAGVCLVLGIGTQPVPLMAIAPMIGGLFYALSLIWTRRYCADEAVGTLALWNMTMFVVAGLVGIALQPLIVQMTEGLDGAGFMTMPFALPDLTIAGIVAIMGLASAIGMVLLANPRAHRPRAR